MRTGWQRISGRAAWTSHSVARRRAPRIVDCFDALTRIVLPSRAVARLRGGDDHERAGDVRPGSITDAFLRIVQRMRSGSARKAPAGRRHGKTSSLVRERYDSDTAESERRPSSRCGPGTCVRRRRRGRGAGCLVRRRCNCLEHAGLSTCCLASPLRLGDEDRAAARPQPVELSFSHAVNFWALFALGPPDGCIGL